MLKSDEMEIRFAVVGYGHIGNRHAGIIQQHPACTLAGICDIADVVAPEGVREFSDLDNMLASTTPEVVCICTPNGLHAQQAIKALQAGAHVICEKPFALTTSDCQAVIKAAALADRHIFCMLQNRYSPQVQWLKTIVEQQLLGELFQVQINCFWNRDDRYYTIDGGDPHPWHGTLEMDGGPLFTQFSHFVDILIWTLGEISIGEVQFQNFMHSKLQNLEDAGHFSFRWKDQSIGSFHYSTAVWDKNQESSITLIGSRGSVRIGGQYMNKVEYCHIEGHPTPEFHSSPIANDYGGYQGSANNHFFVIQNMIDVIHGRAQPDFAIEDACKGIALIEDVYSTRSQWSA